uniref:Uncharacterized protein n=1 Tax=Arundo donax TaxID=35708 RepID=A0A0A9A431_ARUDO
MNPNKNMPLSSILLTSAGTRRTPFCLAITMKHFSCLHSSRDK